MAAARRDLEVDFKECACKQETVPSLADTTSSEEGRWWKEGNNAVEKQTWELPPYSRVHPWITRSTTTASSKCVE